MATTTLSLYQGALRLLKHRRIASTSDTDPARYQLDDVYAGALAYMLEQATWQFASRSASIAASASSNRGYSNRFAKPSDLVRLISISDNASYYPPVEAYDEDSTYFFANVSNLYITYVSDDASYGGDLTKWPETYARAVEAYIATLVGPHLTNSGDIIQFVNGYYDQALRRAMAKDAINRNYRIVSSTTLSIYNGALRIIGARQLTNFDDRTVIRRAVDPAAGKAGPADDLANEMVYRRLLDESYDTAVAYCLELGSWAFAVKSTTLAGSSSANAGYTLRYTKPSDLVRLISISASSSYYPPLEDYADDATYWFGNDANIYIRYVSDDASYGADTTKWTATFRRLVEAKLAMEIAPHAPNAKDAVGIAAATFETNLRIAQAKDTINHTARITTSALTTVFNGALRLVGRRLVANFDDMALVRRGMDQSGAVADKGKGQIHKPDGDVEIEMLLRRLLDESYATALKYVLEQVQWQFATISTSISASATPTRGYASRFTKPSDLVRLVSVSASSTYYPPLEDYAEDATYWYSNDSTIYVTYVSNGASYGADTTKWPATFQRVLEAYLAIEIAPAAGLSGDAITALRQQMMVRLIEARAKDGINRVSRVLSSTTLAAYNGALRLLGRRVLTNFDDQTIQQRFVELAAAPEKAGAVGEEIETEMNLRRLLDESYTLALRVVLEQVQWAFATTSTSLSGASSSNRGYTLRYTKPSDLVRLISISASSSYYPPLEDYAEDATYWFGNDASIYVAYVSNGASYGADTTKWPATFQQLLEAQLALELAPHVKIAADAMLALRQQYAIRLAQARAKDGINRTSRVLSSTTLAAYNGALRLLGRRMLTNFDDATIQHRFSDAVGNPEKTGAVIDDIETEMRLRRLLDESYTLSLRAVLEQVQWSFATTSTTLAGSSSPNRGYTYRYSKPSDLIRLVSISASSTYYPPLEDYAEDATYWFGNDANIYITYVSNGASYGADTTKWPASFQHLLESQLALELAPHLRLPADAMLALRQQFAIRLAQARAKDGVNRTSRVLSSTTLGVYNGALRLLGRRLLTNFDDVTIQQRFADAVGNPEKAKSVIDDVETELQLRRLLDESYTLSLRSVLEQAQWQFASLSTTIAGSSSSNRGYTYRYTKPSDLVRLVSISSSSSYYPPLEDFDGDAAYWFGNVTDIYITYVSSGASYGADTTKWPASFQRALEAHLAVEIAPHLNMPADMMAALRQQLAVRLAEGRAKDAINHTARIATSSLTSLFNGALRLVGKRLVANFDDMAVARRGMDLAGAGGGKAPAKPDGDVEMELLLRRLLDEAYSTGLRHVLEQAQWQFATLSTSISGSASSNRGYSYRYTKPSDLVRLVSVSASASYYPPLENYDQDAAYWYGNESALYITYVSSGASYGADTTKWPASFQRTLEAHLAVEIAPAAGLAPDAVTALRQTFALRLAEARAKDAINRPTRIVSSATLGIYNGVLRLLGKRLLTNFDDRLVHRRFMDSVGKENGPPPADGVETELQLRRLLDETFDDAVDYMLSQGLWNFAQRTVAIEAETDVEPEFGYTYAFEKPDDWVRLVAISDNGNLWPTLDRYVEEGSFLNADVPVLYVQYVSNGATYGGDMSLWPQPWKKALEAYLAVEIAPHALASEPLKWAASKTEMLNREARRLLRDARGKDASDQSAMWPSPGRLVRGRLGTRSHRNDQRREN